MLSNSGQLPAPEMLKHSPPSEKKEGFIGKRKEECGKVFVVIGCVSVDAAPETSQAHDAQELSPSEKGGIRHPKVCVSL